MAVLNSHILFWKTIFSLLLNVPSTPAWSDLTNQRHGCHLGLLPFILSLQSVLKSWHVKSYYRVACINFSFYNDTLCSMISLSFHDKWKRHIYFSIFPTIAPINLKGDFCSYILFMNMSWKRKNWEKSIFGILKYFI